MCNWSIAGRKCIPAMMFSTTCSRLRIRRTGASSLLKPGLLEERLDLEIMCLNGLPKPPWFTKWEHNQHYLQSKGPLATFMRSTVAVGMGRIQNAATKIAGHRFQFVYLKPIGSMGLGCLPTCWLILMVNVGKYTSPMDPMGNRR